MRAAQFAAVFSQRSAMRLERLSSPMARPVRARPRWGTFGEGTGRFLASLRKGMTGRMPRLRAAPRSASASPPLSVTTARGAVSGPIPSGVSNCRPSRASPPAGWKSSGGPSKSHPRRILVPKPPRERPSARPCRPLRRPRPGRAPAPPCCRAAVLPCCRASGRGAPCGPARPAPGRRPRTRRFGPAAGSAPGRRSSGRTRPAARAGRRCGPRSGAAPRGSGGRRAPCRRAGAAPGPRRLEHLERHRPVPPGHPRQHAGPPPQTDTPGITDRPAVGSGSGSTPRNPSTRPKFRLDRRRSPRELRSPVPTAAR